MISWILCGYCAALQDGWRWINLEHWMLHLAEKSVSARTFVKTCENMRKLVMLRDSHRSESTENTESTRWPQHSDWVYWVAPQPYPSYPSPGWPDSAEPRILSQDIARGCIDISPGRKWKHGHLCPRCVSGGCSIYLAELWSSYNHHFSDVTMRCTSWYALRSRSFISVMRTWRHHKHSSHPNSGEYRFI